MTGVVAVRRYGYTTIHYKEVFQLGQRFQLEDLEREARPRHYISPEKQFYRAIIKNLVQYKDVTLTHKKVKKMRSDLITQNQLTRNTLGTTTWSNLTVKAWNKKYVELLRPREKVSKRYAE